MAEKLSSAETDRLLRAGAERLLELAAEKAKDVLETAAVHAKDELADAPGNSKRWHIGKEIPIALVGATVFQTIAFVIWLVQLSGSVGTLNTGFAEFKAEMKAALAAGYSREDARRDRELMDQKLQAQIPIDREFERRVVVVEGRLDRLEHK